MEKQERYATSSSATSDGDYLDFNSQKNIDPQYNLKSASSDYSLKRKNFMDLKETKTLKNMQPSSNKNTDIKICTTSGMTILHYI